MRQKKLSFVTIDLLKSKGVITDIEKLNIDKRKKVHLEVGSGKGQFITSLAKDHPNEFFIAFELNMSVLYRIVEKRDELGLSNLSIILGNANDLLSYFDEKVIDHIYLNFSDPWPKKKHHKRRLTYTSFLQMYLKVLKDDGLLQFRTDVRPFFDDSIDYIDPVFDIFDINYQLEESQYMTEYEEKKRKITTINQLKGHKKL